jgi:hypothetical protein
LLSILFYKKKVTFVEAKPSIVYKSLKSDVKKQVIPDQIIESVNG